MSTTTTALVTGAASGIGWACALALARRGDRLALVDRDEDGLVRVRDAVLALGCQASIHVADLADYAALGLAMTEALDDLGRLDVAINCAGIDAEPEVLADWNLDNARRAIDVNLIGTMICMRAELHLMQQTGKGSIVNMASIASFAALPGKPGYLGSKHGIVGLTRTAAAQYGVKGIRVNAVCPGATRTAMTRHLLENPAVEAAISGATPLGRVAEPEDIAKAALWLNSEEASFITGQALVVDGGYTLGVI